MSGPIGHYFGIMVAGAVWRIGERYQSLVATVLVIRLLARHFSVVLTVAFGLFVWTSARSFAGAVIVSAFVYALVFLGRAALAYRRGSARGLRAILTGMARVATFRDEWPDTATLPGVKMTAGRDSGARVAPLGTMTVRQHGIAVVVAHGRVGASARDLIKAAPAIQVRCDAARARVVETPGHTAYSTLLLDWGEHLRKVYSLADLKRIVDEWGVAPGRVPWGINEEGGPATSDVHLSKLLGALTGSGKSSWWWAYLWGLLDRGYWPRLWILNPKGTELAALGEQCRPKDKDALVHRYVARAEDMVGDRAHATGGIWYDLNAALRDREADVLKAGLRSVEPSERWRSNIVVCDEWLAIADDVKRLGTRHPLAQVAWRGRAVGYGAIASTQAAQLDVAGRWRDLVPERIAFATPNKAGTDAILGDGADSDGARASELDPLHDAGVCYATVPGRRLFEPARSAYVTDAETLVLSRGELPDLTLYETEYQTTHVYVAILAEPLTVDGRTYPAGTIAYVGQTQQLPMTRWSQHKREKWWASKCDWSVLVTYPRLSLALDREAVEIARLRPLFNEQHNKSNPDRVDWRREVPL